MGIEAMVDGRKWVMEKKPNWDEDSIFHQISTKQIWLHNIEWSPRRSSKWLHSIRRSPSTSPSSPKKSKRLKLNHLISTEEMFHNKKWEFFNIWINQLFKIFNKIFFSIRRSAAAEESSSNENWKSSSNINN